MHEQKARGMVDTRGYGGQQKPTIICSYGGHKNNQL